MNRRCQFGGFALLALTAVRVTAHPAPNSVINLDFGRNFVRAEMLLPTSELRYALAAEGIQRTSIAADDLVIAAYLARHVALAAPGGDRWHGTPSSSHLQAFAGHEYLVAAVDFTPPPGSTTRQFIFAADPITHEVRNHVLMIVARSDYRTGLIGDEPELVGFLQYPGRELMVVRASGNAGRGFSAAFSLGVEHIATGADHLLFLLTLLLPAALIAGEGRWLVRRGAKATLMSLFGIVSAFTVGHSSALIVAAASGWRVAASGVETLIALSVLASSMHAWRPIFPGREALVAGAFGLCHGLAFARALGGHLPDSVDTGAVILGFNLGIECFQLLIVLASIPVVIQLAPGGYGGAARRALAAVSAVAALGWLAERALDVSNPLSTVLGSVTMSTTLSVVGATLAVGAVLCGTGVAKSRNIRTALRAQLRLDPVDGGSIAVSTLATVTKACESLDCRRGLSSRSPLIGLRPTANCCCILWTGETVQSPTGRRPAKHATHRCNSEGGTHRCALVRGGLRLRSWQPKWYRSSVRKPPNAS